MISTLALILSVAVPVLFVLWVVTIEWKRANHSPAIVCEEFPCMNHRKYGTLWCENHQPRKPQLETLEERLL